MKKPINFFRKNLLFIVVIGVLAVLEMLSVLFLSGGIASIFSYLHKQNTSIQGIILFESANCEQCAKVEDFIKANKIENMVGFTRLEVVNNDANYDLLSDKAQICGLNTSQIGVPFLWDGAHCVIGYVDVITFFKTKTSVKKP